MYKQDHNITNFTELTLEDEKVLFSLLNETSKKGAKFVKKDSGTRGGATDLFHEVNDIRVSLPLSVVQYKFGDEQEENNDQWFVKGKVLGLGSFGHVKPLYTVKKNPEQKKVTVSEASDWVVKIQVVDARGLRLRERTVEEWQEELKKESQLTQLVYPESKHCFKSNELSNRHKAYLIMPKVPGLPLDKLNFHTFNFIERMEMAIAIGEALKEIHKKGIVHRDLSLGNIFYDKNNKKAYIIDFGLSKIIGEEDTDISGNSTYMAPEAIDLETDFSSDVFSYGGIILEILGAKKISKDRCPHENDEEDQSTIKTARFNFDGLFANFKISATNQGELRSLLEVNTALEKSQRPRLERIIEKLKSVKKCERDMKNREILANASNEKLKDVYNLIQKRIDKLESWSFINASDHSKAELLRNLQDEIVHPNNVGKTLDVILGEWETAQHTYLHCNEKKKVETKIVIGAHRNSLFTPPLTATQVLIKRLRRDYGESLLNGNQNNIVAAEDLLEVEDGNNAPQQETLSN